MPLLSSAQALVARNIVLDGRLALFHQRQRWLAVADLHFGYELSQRVAGRLMPMWGMESTEQRLLELVADYEPHHLLILGDLVHDGAGAAPARELMTRLANLCETVLIAGNHDRQLPGTISMVEAWKTAGFHFHHGHSAVQASDRIQIIGHHHPAGTLRDGAGLRLKLPAFVQTESLWILPAFSPWAPGTMWTGDGRSQIWLCTPQRVLRLTQPAKAAN